jgi:hypothetical protein
MHAAQFWVADCGVEHNFQVAESGEQHFAQNAVRA